MIPIWALWFWFVVSIWAVDNPRNYNRSVRLISLLGFSPFWRLFSRNLSKQYFKDYFTDRTFRPTIIKRYLWRARNLLSGLGIREIEPCPRSLGNLSLSPGLTRYCQQRMWAMWTKRNFVTSSGRSLQKNVVMLCKHFISSFAVRFSQFEKRNFRKIWQCYLQI